MSSCKWHLCNKLLQGKQTKFCSSNCKNKYYVDRRRRHLKQRAIQYKGGRCQVCGYDKCNGALVFHHLHSKEFGLSQRGMTRAWNKVRKELDKCTLLCANCHAEIHCRVTQSAE